MLRSMSNVAIYCKAKVDAWFARVFKEQAGGAELIATLIIIAVVLVLALAFRENLTNLVSNLWNSLIRDQETGAPSVPSWE